MMHDDLECSVNVIEYSFPVHSTSFYMCVSSTFVATPAGAFY